jgi:transcriptional regulator with AAA-type ATPase domain
VKERETVSEHDGAEPIGSMRPRAPQLTLVTIWSRDEPWRIGQSLTIPAADPRRVFVFGRGPAAPEESARLQLFEARPGGNRATPPLDSPAISRTQLELQHLGLRRLRVRNVGRCKLFVAGEACSEAELAPGSLLRLGRQLLLFLTERTPVRAASLDYPEFDFGLADAFGMVGESSACHRLRYELSALAGRAGHVLISGASGTGKEFAARALHALSARRGRPLLARNAATLPESLLDAELFGNLRGYPNVGMPERSGLIGEAHGSSLFLDEIAELPHAAQAHLLRVLDAGEYHRLGEAKARHADFRLLGASNRAPSALKHDLLARLVLRVELPTLAERREDIPLLVRHLIRRAARANDALALGLLQGDPQGEPALDCELMEQLLSRNYPANVRELESVLWQGLNGVGLGERPLSESGAIATSSLEASRIQRGLDENNGAIEQTWRSLGLKNRFVLLRLIKKFNLEVRRRPAASRARPG